MPWLARKPYMRTAQSKQHAPKAQNKQNTRNVRAANTLQETNRLVVEKALMRLLIQNNAQNWTSRGREWLR